MSAAVVMPEKGAVSWHSRTQAVTTSGALEADYVALSEAVKDVLFLKPMQDFLEPSICDQRVRGE